MIFYILIIISKKVVRKVKLIYSIAATLIATNLKANSIPVSGLAAVVVIIQTGVSAISHKCKATRMRAISCHHYVPLVCVYVHTLIEMMMVIINLV